MRTIPDSLLSPTRYYLLCWSLLCSTFLLADCSPRPAFYGYRFLDPSLLEYNSELAPFYEAFGAKYADLTVNTAELRRRDNLQEWYDRYCEQVDPEDIESLLYGNTAGTLRRVMDLSARKGATDRDLPEPWRQNSFASHLVEYRCTEVAQYLFFAKRVEPYVVARKKTFATQTTAKAEMESFIEEGLAYFLEAESHYVRLRYAYQLIRLAHYLGEYDYVIELYDYLLPKTSADPSILYDWIESHRAGALRELGDYPQSAYLFSRVFANCASCREAAHRSFRIRSDAEWTEAYQLCANDRERAMLHVLRAQDRRAHLVREMEYIFALDPNNPALEPLLMRELLDLERDLMGQDVNPNKAANRRLHRRPGPKAGKRLIDLQAFVQEVIAAGSAARPDLWLLARGTIELLAGDHYYADETFADLLEQSGDAAIRKQTKVLRTVSDLLALGYADDEIERYYYKLLQNNALQEDYPDLVHLINDKLEVVYRQTGKEGKATLLRYGFDAIQKHPQLSMIDELNGMADSLTGNIFDRRLLEVRAGKNVTNDLHHLTGLYYLQRGQWEIALDNFRKIPAARRADYGTFAPFVKQFHDRVNFSPPGTAARYDLVTLIERLNILEEEARQTRNDTVATRNYFNLGLAHYNSSYFSYNWKFGDDFRSSTSAERAAKRRSSLSVFSHSDAPLGNLENMNMDRARYYFERAAAQAPTREAAVEALYYAAKAERNGHYAAGRPGGERPFTNFTRIEGEYRDTRYYNYLIEECRTFAWFAQRQ